MAMGLLKQSILLLSAIGVATLGIILYTPLPEGMEQPWKLRIYYAKSKLIVLSSILTEMLGYDNINVTRYLLDMIQLTNGSSQNDSYLNVDNIKLDGIQSRIYRPKDTEGSLPCFIYFHGGGFAYSINTYDGVTAKIARDSGIVVISVEYRLIPEHPYPAAVDDAYTAVMYILKHGQKLGVNVNKISIGGDSAGGNMAAAVALKLRDNSIQPKLHGQVLIYPVLQVCDLFTPSQLLGARYLFDGRTFAADVTKMYLGLPERFNRFILEENYSSPELTKKCKRFVNVKYLPKSFVPEEYTRTDVTAEADNEDAQWLGEKMSDPYFCPLMAEIVSDLPQTLVLTSELDHIRDDGIMYASRLQKAGVKTQWHHLPDSFHGVLTMVGDGGFEAGVTMINHIVNFLKEIS